MVSAWLAMLFRPGRMVEGGHGWFAQTAAGSGRGPDRPDGRETSSPDRGAVPGLWALRGVHRPGRDGEADGGACGGAVRSVLRPPGTGGTGRGARDRGGVL